MRHTRRSAGGHEPERWVRPVTPSAAPEVPTVPTFRNVDDIDWTPVQRQRNADGSESVIRERWPIIRPGFLSAWVHYEPGMVVRRHGHRSNHVVILLDGGAWIAGAWCGPGTHIHVPLGAAFGPIVAGPDGVTCWELSFGELGGWGDRAERYEAAIAGPDFESARVTLGRHPPGAGCLSHGHVIVPAWQPRPNGSASADSVTGFTPEATRSNTCGSSCSAIAACPSWSASTPGPTDMWAAHSRTGMESPTSPIGSVIAASSSCRVDQVSEPFPPKATSPVGSSGKAAPSLRETG